MRPAVVACALFLGIPHCFTPVNADDAKIKAPPLKVTVDTTDAPDLAPWAAKAKEIVEKWHPLIAELLKSEGFTAPSAIKLVFKPDKKGVAATSGDVITFSADYVRKHPDDWGLVVHELTHIIQAYPGGAPFWLTEGIADYIRLYHFEPDTRRPTINPDKSSYKDGYRTSAAFLHWVEKTYDKQLVNKVNASLRSRRYDPEQFKEYTKLTLDELWGEFLKTVKK